ncbi:hypothetical protein I4U23_016895 [Adineta vaga]|nr:hypothetical protein I4U23_016895 [Adineta vaga]
MNPVIVLKHQKYQTWLYIILHTVCLYILFYVTLIKIEPKTVVISDVTHDLFYKLSSEHNQTLSCQCKTVTIPHKNFVLQNIIMHPICSSVFVDKQWIEGLYFSNASLYGVWDFRTTAYSQFKLLSEFCLFSKEIIIQIQKDINNTDFISIELVPEMEIRKDVDGILELQTSSASIQMLSFLNYLRTTIQGHTLVTGLGCTPLESLLASTLDCFYSFECIELLLNYFPNLNQTHFNLNNSILSSNYKNIPITNYLNIFFIENWSLEIDYSFYFNQCSPSICTYTRNHRTNLSYAITLFISLYGGLTIILRLISSFFIKILFKFKNHQNNQTNNFNSQITKVFELKKSIEQLNLFKNILQRTEDSIKRQKIITRVYLILLFGTISALCLFTLLQRETVIKYESNPTIKTYNSLEIIYASTLRCPCSNKTISYKNFLYFSPVFHQICSSSFVQNGWIEMIKLNAGILSLDDWRNKAYPQFQILSDLCQLANKTIIDAIDRFLNQFFISSSLINENDFSKQLNTTLNLFYNSTVYNFIFLKDIVSLIMQVDQFYMGPMQITSSDDKLGVKMNLMFNETNNDSIVQIQFILNEIEDINSSLNKCICAINPHCQSSAFLYSPGNLDHHNRNTDRIYNISGWIQSCLAIESLQFSTFQCLYEDSDCFPILLSFLNKMEMFPSDVPSQFNLQPLIYDPTVTRYPFNVSFSRIINELMIEKWNPVLSYKIFYESCAPLYCSYSQTIRKTSFIRLIITLVSMLGGIVVSLRILTPHLVNIILKFSKKFKSKTNQRSQVRHNFFVQLKNIILNLIKLLRNVIVELNIFTLRNFGTDVDRITVKHYGRLATRLYLILFTVGISILIFYGIIQLFISTKSFNKPSLIVYKHLKQLYGDDLKCKCSVIASTYDHFVTITPIFHSICSSQYVLEEWRLDFVNGLIPNLNFYEQRDYRRFLSAHLQYLQGLCRLSQQTINNTIDNFLRSLLITVELLSENHFENHFNILTEQSKSNAPIIFSRFLFFTRSIFHGNAFMSTYGTNFEYIVELRDDTLIYIPAKAVIYDDECSCGISSNCTTQAIFIERNSSINITIQGMKMGCTPSESFLSSTLECFYNQSCLNLIQQYTNWY